MKVYVLFSFCAVVFSGGVESYHLNLHNDNQQSLLQSSHPDLESIVRRSLNQHHNHNLQNLENSQLWSQSLRKSGGQWNQNIQQLSNTQNLRRSNNLDSLNQENNKLLNRLHARRQGGSDDINLMSLDDYSLLNSALVQHSISRQGNPNLDSPNLENRFSIGINAGINAGPGPYGYGYGYPMQPVAPMYGPGPYYGKK
ncbi:uncharacterized protein LOC124635335 [Helicoverpa zea]|uniref:uncharacterized protein LOC124635335 n=1 Tax=Helicoverpa zea TaxID=7113 RepID=UPI001F59CE22|nr:uncharacterized protein LOC124635335 [Helicoverpa zea]